MDAKLIEHLVADLRPVARLPSPVMRTIYWLIPVLVASALLVAGLARPDTARTISDPLQRLEVMASLITAILAAYAAFSTSIPGRAPWLSLLPVPSLLAWIAIIVYGTWLKGMQEGWSVADFRPAWSCIFLLGAYSLLPAAILVFMLRQAAPVLRERTAILAGIAIGSLSVLMLRLTLFHPPELMPEMLIEHLGAMLLVISASVVASDWLLKMPRSCPGEQYFS